LLQMQPLSLNQSPATKVTDPVIVVTDGSANNLNGSGGWCAIIRTPTTVTELVGWEEGTTSNRMEMTAVVNGLLSISTPSNISLVADSAYVLNSLKNKWYVRWFEEDAKGTRVDRPNLDLWYVLAGLVQYHNVSFIKIKGHSGDYWNERADKLAGHARVNKVQSNTTHPYPVLGEIDGNTVAQSHSL
jgi:ribonuclease HI